MRHRPTDPSAAEADSTPRLLRADLHVHTDTSRDSMLSPAGLVQACLRRGLDCVAVTDHDRLAGAWAVAELAPAGLRVIVGEEVCTAQGELLALFLREEVPAGQDALDTARLIRAQGGLVGVSHPCDRWRRALAREELDGLLQNGLLDFIEGRNGRVIGREDNARAEELGRLLRLPLTAGSDAHSPGEVGVCSTLLPPFHGPADFLSVLAQGQLLGRASPPWIHLLSMAARFNRPADTAR